MVGLPLGFKGKKAPLLETSCEEWGFQGKKWNHEEVRSVAAKGTVLSN